MIRSDIDYLMEFRQTYWEQWKEFLKERCECTQGCGLERDEIYRINCELHEIYDKEGNLKEE